MLNPPPIYFRIYRFSITSWSRVYVLLKMIDQVFTQFKLTKRLSLIIIIIQAIIAINRAI